MYCKHCGQIIDDNSQFCSHCGKSQDNSNNSLTKKTVWVIYFIWAIANLFLLMGDKEADASDYFFPFTANEHTMIGSSYIGNWYKDYYDFSEFVVYVGLIPIFLYVVYRRYNKQIDKLVNSILNK